MAEPTPLKHPTANPRRVEEASLNAWPALQQLLYDGWLLRFARGFTKRANCIVPLYPESDHAGGTLLERVRFCENLYAREGLTTIFRLTSMSDRGPLDRLLEDRGYQITEPSLVLWAALPPGSCASPQHARDQVGAFARRDLDQWLDTYARLTGMPPQGRTLHRAILRAIPGDCAFGVLHDGDEDLACGLAVVEDRTVGLFDIVTAPGHRRRGVGGQLVSGLLSWAGGRGAAEAYLQVLESNAPARALYGRLGFGELYSYYYRKAP
jgi:GNAT superfamily N-acetyltransferase